MEYNIKELNIEDIYDETFTPASLTLYRIKWDDVIYDFLINHIPHSKKAAIFGTGAMSDRRKKLPFFARPTWHNEIDVTSIWYSDPTLYEGKLKIYWYYGNNNNWYLENIAFLLTVIAGNMGVDLTNSLFTGSSGGGYSSLVLATLLRGRATVINPQLFLYNYNKIHYQRFLNERFAEGESPIEERIDVVKLFARERYVPRTKFLQNIKSSDIDKQITPFLLDLSHNKYDCNKAISIDFYFDSRGHNGMPSKEDTLAYIDMGLKDTETGSELIDIKAPGASLSFYERISRVDPHDKKAHIRFDIWTKPEKNIKQITAVWQSDNVLLCKAETYFEIEDYEFAFYLLNAKDRVVNKCAYSKTSVCTFSGIRMMKYTLNCFVRIGKKTGLLKYAVTSK